ncbi:MAG: hypothetical protein HC799_05935 [Limnothrix sp. RL_2_0]|nr:hypothetical protein [Limnothrix sp. RL_2_0]
MSTLQQTVTEKLICKGLPLAVYREVAAHLRQVQGIFVELEPQRSPDFDYHQSQIGAMVITYSENFAEGDRQNIEKILAFYAERHGEWQQK